MKGLPPGRRLALGAALAALIAGVVIAIASIGGGHSAHRLPHMPARALQPGAPRRTGSGSRAAPGGQGGGGSATAPGSQPSGGGQAGHRPTRPPALLQVAARYLGVPAPGVRRELQAGRTLAQVAAKRPGRTVAGLIDALAAARGAAIRRAAAEGRISKQVADTRLARVHKVITRAVEHAPPGAPSVAVPLRPAASYLGIGIKKLRTELRKDRTLAEIADATPGRSAKGLVDALVAIRRTDLDRLAKAGHIKKDRERTLLATYRERLTARIKLRRS